MYALTFVPFFFVYFETAFFLGVFFVALPSAAPTSPAIKDIGMAQHRRECRRALTESSGATRVIWWKQPRRFLSTPVAQRFPCWRRRDQSAKIVRVKASYSGLDSAIKII
jgi:hypothetical protein